MGLVDSLRIAAAALGTHKLRAALNLVGIIIAVTTIVAVISVVNGLNRYAGAVIGQLGPNTFVVSKFGIITSREEYLEARKRKDYTVQDLAAVRRLVPQALHVSGQVATRLTTTTPGQRLAGVVVQGTGPEYPFMVGMEIEDGRFFSAAEYDGSRPVAVLGWDVRDELFPHVDPIGRLIRVEGQPLRVIGVLKRQGSAFGQNQDLTVVMPLTSFQKAFGRYESVDIVVEAPSSAALPAVRDSVRVVLRARRDIPFRAPDPFGIVDADALQTIWRSITFSAFALVVVLSSISLVVGGVAVANTMFASVVERTREIGIRRALGARRWDVLRQFLLEAVMLTLIGGAVGVGVGWLAALAVGRLSPLPATVTPGLVATGLGVALVAGVVSGFFPARRAASLDPIEALREE